MTDNWTIPQTPDTERTNKGRWWIWVVAIILGCFCLVCAGVIGVLVYYGQESEGLTLEYSIPSIVQKGDTFDFVLTLTNTGSEPINIDDIDLDEVFSGSILDGCIVLDTEPHMERDYSLEGIKTFKYDRSIGVGETREVIFHLQATQVGEFGGAVGVYTGEKSKHIDYVGIVVQE